MKSEEFAFAFGRAAAKVEAHWTQGAYTRHWDGRALTKIGTRGHSVDVVGALIYSAHDLGLSEEDIEEMRAILNGYLPLFYGGDRNFGLERWNDVNGRTVDDVISLLRKGQKYCEQNADQTSAFVTTAAA